MKKQKEKPSRKPSKKKLYVILAVLVIFACVLASVGGDKEESGAAQSTQEQTAETEPGNVPAERQPEDTEDAKTGNPLMDAEVSVSDVMNGTKTDKLGEWAEVQADKETMKGITQEQFSEFCNARVKDSGYNWYTINCGDGTGIQFAGSISSVATYGTIDNEGCITESFGTIMVQADGTYNYTEAE